MDSAPIEWMLISSRFAAALAARDSTDAGHIEDERDAAIAENRGTGNAGDGLVVGLQALDDHLLLADDLVEHDGDLVAGPGLDDDHESLGGVGGRVGDAEHASD